MSLLKKIPRKHIEIPDPEEVSVKSSKQMILKILEKMDIYKNEQDICDTEEARILVSDKPYNFGAADRPALRLLVNLDPKVLKFLAIDLDYDDYIDLVEKYYDQQEKEDTFQIFSKMLRRCPEEQDCVDFLLYNVILLEIRNLYSLLNTHDLRERNEYFCVQSGGFLKNPIMSLETGQYYEKEEYVTTVAPLIGAKNIKEKYRPAEELKKRITDYRRRKKDFLSKCLIILDGIHRFLKLRGVKERIEDDQILERKQKNVLFEPLIKDEELFDTPEEALKYLTWKDKHVQDYILEFCKMVIKYNEYKGKVFHVKIYTRVVSIFAAFDITEEIDTYPAIFKHMFEHYFDRREFVKLYRKMVRKVCYDLKITYRKESYSAGIKGLSEFDDISSLTSRSEISELESDFQHQQGYTSTIPQNEIKRQALLKSTNRLSVDASRDLEESLKKCLFYFMMTNYSIPCVHSSIIITIFHKFEYFFPHQTKFFTRNAILKTYIPSLTFIKKFRPVRKNIVDFIYNLTNNQIVAFSRVQFMNNFKMNDEIGGFLLRSIVTKILEILGLHKRLYSCICNRNLANVYDYLGLKKYNREKGLMTIEKRACVVRVFFYDLKMEKREEVMASLLFLIVEYGIKLHEKIEVFKTLPHVTAKKIEKVDEPIPDKDELDYKDELNLEEISVKEEDD